MRFAYFQATSLSKQRKARQMVVSQKVGEGYVCGRTPQYSSEKPRRGAARA